MLRHEWCYQHPGRRFPLDLFSGVIVLFIYPQSVRKGVVRRAANQKSIDCRWQSHLCLMADMYVTWDNLFEFCTVILTVILLVFQMMNNKEK